jgi:hypothetical protein
MVQTDPGVGMMKRRGLRWALAAGAALPRALSRRILRGFYDRPSRRCVNPTTRTPVSAGLRAQEVWIEKREGPHKAVRVLLPGGSDRAIVSGARRRLQLLGRQRPRVARAYLARGTA